MLAIIPARGGSKGVPRKNVKLLGGKPLIAHTIEAAQASKQIDRIVLSTDDQGIASIGKKYGVDLPFMRPKSLALDTSLAIETYLYTLNRLNREREIKYSDFIVLQPTCPFRTSEDIDTAIKIYYEKQADSVISVVEASHPPVWAKLINSSGLLEDYFPSAHNNKNRQDIKPAYMPNGAVFILKLFLLTEYKTYYFNNTHPYVMPPERSIDIDTLIDFEFAEYMMNRKITQS